MVLQPALVAEMQGSQKGVTATFEGVPVLACPSGHERRYPFAEFGSGLAKVVAREIRRPKRRFLGATRCSACDNELDAKKVQSETLSLTIRLENFTPFQVTFVAPWVRCACGRRHVRRAEESLLFDAMIRAFESAKLGP